MGWGYGVNDDGREVGYSVEATCDFPKCKARINRGLGYACGERHDSMEGGGCAHYFCMRHGGGTRWEGQRVHTLATHVRTQRNRRRKIAAELLEFRRLHITAAEVYNRWYIWRFVPKHMHPEIGKPCNLDAIKYRGAA